MGLKTAAEAFADRGYQPDGTLTPRSHTNAVFTQEDQVVNQLLQIIKQQKVTDSSGNLVELKADTICLHGDGVHALSFAKAIYKSLLQENIVMTTV